MVEWNWKLKLKLECNTLMFINDQYVSIQCFVHMFQHYLCVNIIFTCCVIQVKLGDDVATWISQTMDLLEVGDT
jgi:hypothetical protein